MPSSVGCGWACTHASLLTVVTLATCASSCSTISYSCMMPAQLGDARTVSSMPCRSLSSAITCERTPALVS